MEARLDIRVTSLLWRVDVMTPKGMAINKQDKIK